MVMAAVKVPRQQQHYGTCKKIAMCEFRKGTLRIGTLSTGIW
jgi:hypothetical protein